MRSASRREQYTGAGQHFGDTVAFKLGFLFHNCALPGIAAARHVSVAVLMSDDFRQMALDEAHIAARAGEVPVGGCAGRVRRQYFGANAQSNARP